MATRKPKQTEDHFVRSLNPRDGDTQYMGSEPFFPDQPRTDYRNIALARSFSWYNRFYGKKDAKELLAQYLEFNKRTDQAKQIRKVPENEFLMTLCWLARMNMRGLELTEHEQKTLENEINRVIQCLAKPSMTEVEKEEPVVARPNIQEVLREKAREAAGELEGLFDEFITSGAPTRHSLRPMDEVAKKNVVPQHINLLVEVWKKKQTEFEEVLNASDVQVIQGYSHLTKTQIKNIIKFIEQVLTDLNSYVSVKKASKAPRQRKAVPVEKIVAKLKYIKEFKDPANKLELVSVHPTKLHGASEAWVYDTAKRKLHHYIADEYSKSFTVKGNTLLGFDTAKSEVKTLRKPAEQIKEIMGSKPAARKYFNDIKAVPTTPNGRFNEGLIILKAF
jgi:Asp-tRNA(Asn)/Glu-tRNA(Gln) amidotransferase C subunit